MAARHRSLFCVGDLDQSIYAWRGADYRNILRLREDNPDIHVIPLEQTIIDPDHPRRRDGGDQTQPQPPAH